jgi:uncharacterized protein
VEPAGLPRAALPAGLDARRPALVAGTWPVLVALVAVGPVVGRAAPAPEPEPSLLLALGYYALVSVSSQEFLYSSFFFWRYRPLFSPGFLVGLNALVFAVAHLVYHSWVSVLLALGGRVIMARIYRRYGSFWGVWAIHLLFGVAVFLVGLGRYFYRAAG